MSVYFCDPHSLWQRGRNENTNGLIRQYLLKGTNLLSVSYAELDTIADETNGQPRRTCRWACPFEVYSGWLAKLGALDEAIQQTSPALHLNLRAPPVKPASIAIKNIAIRIYTAFTTA